MVEIVLQYFLYALNNPRLWPKVLPQIQAFINNTSSSLIGKTPNEMTYGFSPCRLFDFLAAFPTLNTVAACADIAEAISFAFFNQKMTYNCRYQLLFIKVGEWAMLQLHKEYSISAMTGVIKKLT